MSLCPSNSFTVGRSTLRHHQATGEGMPQIVEREIDDLSLLYRCLKSGAERLIGHAVAVAKHQTVSRSGHFNRLERRGQYIVHRHASGVAILGVGRLHCDDASAEVDIVPGQGQQLRLAKPGVERSQQQRAELRAAVCQQPRFFVQAEPADAAIVFSRKPHFFGQLRGN